MLKRRILASLTMVVALLMALTFSTPVMAEYATTSGVWLNDSGADSQLPTGENWTSYLQVPSYVGLDEYSGYWNFTCYFPTNDSATLIHNFTVTLYIDDGTTNISGNTGSVECSITGTVYSNISIAEATYSALTANATASFWVKLYDDDSSTTNDTYLTTIRITDYGFIGMVWALIPLMIGFAIISAMMGLVSGSGKRGGKGKGKKSGGKKGRKR